MRWVGVHLLVTREGEGLVTGAVMAAGWPVLLAQDTVQTQHLHMAEGGRMHVQQAAARICTTLMIPCLCMILAAAFVPWQAVAKKMMADAGFTAVEMLEWGSELNAYYLAKP